MLKLPEPPETTAHVPVPDVAVLPARVIAAPKQTVCADPAVAVVGTPLTLMVTSDADAVHALLLMVQRNT